MGSGERERGKGKGETGNDNRQSAICNLQSAIDNREKGGWEMGVAGWLCEPRNPQVLSELLREVLAKSPEQLRVIGSAGRTRTEESFSAGKYAAEVAQVLRAAAG